MQNDTQISEYNLKKLQEAELSILCAVGKICDDNGIEWFLEGGTALGAARHSGFIPWDDDVDISMMRDDYERFLDVAPSKLPNWLRLDDPAKNAKMAAMFAKVCIADSIFETQETRDAGYNQGIFIDIFPYDYISENERVRKRQYGMIRKMTAMKYLKGSPNVNVPHRGLLGKAELLGCAVAHKAIKAIYSEQKQQKTVMRYIALGKNAVNADNPLVRGFGNLPSVRKNMIFPTKRIEFCGETLPAPGQLDTFLQCKYGDWRKLPPEDQRKTHKPIRIVFPAQA